MKKTPIALAILERERVRQIIKFAVDGPLAQPVPPQPVKPNTAEKVVPPIKPIAQMGKTTGGQSGRWAFDKQGPGDAQARAAIYDKTKQIGAKIHGASSRFGDYVGSMLPVGRPGNSGLDNKPMSIVDTTRADIKQMGSDVKQFGTQLNNARVQAGNAVGNYVGSMLPVGRPGNSGVGNKPMSMADEMRGTLNQMGSDVKQVGTQINNARVQAGNAVGDYVGSMLPVGRPGNSGLDNKPSTYAYGPGGGGAGLPDAAGLVSKAVNAAGVNPAAYGAAPAQGPMGTGIPGPGQDPAAYGAAPAQGPQPPAARGVPASTTDTALLPAFGSGLRQGVGNMAGGIYNFGRGMANFGVGAVGSATVGAAQLGARGMDAAGLADNSAQFFDSIAKPFNDATVAGASDMANSFGQYVGVREAPTAVADMRTQQRAELSPSMQTAHDIANGASDMAVGTGAYMLPGSAAGRIAAGTAGAAATMLPNAAQPIARGIGAVANTYGNVTGLSGKWQAPVAMGTQVVREGIVRPLDQIRGTNYADNVALFPGQLLAPTENAVAQTQVPETPATQAADAGGGFSPEMEKFLTDNNIQTAADFDNLTEQQQLQFQDLYEKEQQPAAPTGAAAAGANPAAWGAAPPQGPTDAAGQTAPQTQQAAQQPAQQQAQQSTQQPAQAVDHKPYETVLNDPKATREQKEAARTDYAKKWVETNKASISPELKSAAEAWQKDPNSPEAKPFADKQTAAFNDLVQQQLAQQPEAAQNPDMFGQIVAGATDMWNNMGTMGQMALAFGVPMAMVGLLGGSGLGLVLGGLGLGFAGAAGGMFGADAQQFTSGLGNTVMSGLHTMLGGADPAATPAPAADPGTTYAAEAEKMQQQPQITPPANAAAGPPAAPQSQLSDAPAPAGTKPGVQTAGLPAAQAELVTKVQQNPNAFFENMTKNPKDGLPLLDLPEETMQQLYLGLAPEQQQALLKTLANPNWNALGPLERSVGPVLYGDKIQKAHRALAGIKKASVIVDRMRKAARCWAGYEPVPGKKPYSNNSCRPKGKTKKKTEKKAADRGGSFVIGRREAPAPVGLNGAWTPEMTAGVAPLLQTHPRYKKTDLSDPVKARGATMSLLKTHGLSPDLRDNLHRVVGSRGDHRGLANFPGMPAAAPAGVPPPPRPVVSAPAAPAASAASPPTPRPQAATPPAPVQPPPRRPDGRPSMIPFSPPQTTSTGPASPPVSSIGANGKYQPSVFSSKGVGLPR